MPERAAADPATARGWQSRPPWAGSLRPNVIEGLGTRHRNSTVPGPCHVRCTVVRAAELRLMCVLAHPDDESLGTGGVLAKCSTEGVATYLVTATRGERGRFGDSK